MRRLSRILPLILVLIIAGCADRVDDDAGQPAATQPPADETPAATEPTPTPDDATDDPEPTPTQDPAEEPPADVDFTEATDSTIAFGFDMFHGLAELDPDENVITSPYSAAVLLTMLLDGADGETREAIGDVLHLEDPYNDTFTAQHQALTAELMDADPDVELSIANSLWANEGTPFEDEYIHEMQEVLDALVEEIDLGSDEAVDQIDEWVAEQTNDRIEEMAEALGVPDPNLVLILLNAVYFLADWTDPFDPDNTSDGMFTTATGDEVEVPLMNKDDEHLHAEGDGFQMVRLPYGEEERFAMDVLLPDEGTDIHQFRSEFEFDAWQSAAAELSELRVDVTMPTFELEYDTGEDLNEVLEDLGMGIAYTGEADFTPMSSVAPFLSTVVQKTYIRVDEEGTEAAAVPGGAMVESMPPQFRADRPFIFMITDTETDTLLFLGQVTDPSDE
jgi:serine protease inhibitor